MTFNDAFTSREKQVLEGILQGLSNKTIGTRLGISERTVKYHVSNVFTKTRSADRKALLAAAAQELRRIATTSPATPPSVSSIVSRLGPSDAAWLVGFAGS